MLKLLGKETMMKLPQKIVGLLVGVIFMSLSFSSGAKASELNFGIAPVIPENQIDKSESYFDLKVLNQEKQLLELKVANRTEKVVTVETDLKRATTNVNGIVEYGENENSTDKSLKMNIEEIVTVLDKEKVLKPNSEGTIRIEIKAINADFPGVLASGLTFKEKVSESEEEQQEEQGLAIKNEYAYVVALLLQGNVLQNDITSELLLNKVQPDQLNYRNVIIANLQNPQPKYLNKIKIDGQVRKKGKTETLYAIKKENLQFAPNSNVDFPIPLEGEKLKAGVYELILDVVSDSGKWHFQKEFTITAEKAKALNKQDVSIEEDNTIWYVIVGAVALLLLTIIILIIVIRKKDKKTALLEQVSKLEN